MDAEPDDTQWVVVARADASARILPGEAVGFTGLTTDHGVVEAIVRTEWFDEGYEAPFPRELIIEVRGPAPSLEEAVAAFLPVAQFLGTTLAFAGNAHVGRVEVLLGFDATPAATEREYLQTYFPPSHRLPAEGRLVKQDLYRAIVGTVTARPDHRRIAQAVAHYELALRDWSLGGEALSLSHLFIAAETLSNAVVRARCDELGVTDEELARSFGLETDNPARPRWKQLLLAEARKRLIFQGDEAVFKAATEASDGFEHGFMTFSKVNELARESTLKTFEYVRAALVGLLGLDDGIADRLCTSEPADVLSFRKTIRGKLIGPGDPNAPGQPYPYLEWSSSIDDATWKEDGGVALRFNESYKPVCGDGVAFRGTAFQVRARPRAGVPVTLEDADVTVVEDSPPRN